jgi:ABC-type multidrug transport system fused ATPase/permease subunit
MIVSLGFGVYLFFSFSVKLSKSLFHDINHQVFNAPINLYFDRNPTGVILNRFSKDLNNVDNNLPV